MSFKDVLCQDRAVEAFDKAMKSGRLGHAYIFAGDDGVGRYLMARQWAKALLCEQPLAGEAGGCYDSCGVCRSCRLFDSDNHPDFKHIYKELLEFTKDTANRKKAPNQMSIDVIREFLVDIAASRPQMAKRAVYVVSEAEKMGAGAQNAMLKTLEEPPGYCVIILLCTRTDMLLPTILSRCQVIRFGSVDEQVIVDRLVAAGHTETASRFWARFTGGSLGQSMVYASLANGCDCYQIKRELVERIVSLRLVDCIDAAEWMVAQNAAIGEALAEAFPDVSKADLKRRAQKMMLKMLLVLICDVMRVSVSHTEGLVNADQFSAVESLCGQLDIDDAAKYVEKVNKNMLWVDAYVNEKLIFEEILLHFAKLKCK